MYSLPSPPKEKKFQFLVKIAVVQSITLGLNPVYNSNPFFLNENKLLQPR
jgi:hypothetical protein